MAKSSPNLIRAWFKVYQRDDIYHYVEVVGGPGKTPDGYQTTINFLNPAPIIEVSHNDLDDPNMPIGTWDRYVAGEVISEDEYTQALNTALSHPEVKMI